MLDTLPSDLISFTLSFLCGKDLCSLLQVLPSLLSGAEGEPVHRARARRLGIFSPATTLPATRAAPHRGSSTPWALTMKLQALYRRPSRVRRVVEEVGGGSPLLATVDSSLHAPNARAYGTSAGEVRVFQGLLSTPPGGFSRTFLVGAGSVRHMAWVTREDGSISALLVGSWAGAVHRLDLEGFPRGVGGGGRPASLPPPAAAALARPAVMPLAQLESSSGPVYALLATPFRVPAARWCAGGGAPAAAPPLPLERKLGTLCLSCGDGKLRVVDAASRSTVGELAGHALGVTDLLICAPGLDLLVCAPPGAQRPTVVSASYDGELRVWDLLSQRCRGVMRGHKGPVWSVVGGSVAPRDGLCGEPAEEGLCATVFSGGADGEVRVWRVPLDEPLGGAGGGEGGGGAGSEGSGAPPPPVQLKAAQAFCLPGKPGQRSQLLCLHAAGGVLFGGTSAGVVYAWDSRSGAELWRVRFGGGEGGAKGSAAARPSGVGADAGPWAPFADQEGAVVPGGGNDGVRRINVVGPFLFATMSSGATTALELARDDLPLLREEWDLALSAGVAAGAPRDALAPEKKAQGGNSPPSPPAAPAKRPVLILGGGPCSTMSANGAKKQ